MSIESRNTTVPVASSKPEWHPIYPDLFIDLRDRANEKLTAKMEQATKLFREMRKDVVDKVEITEVEPQPSHRLRTCIAADSSSYPLPFAISRMALVGAIAIRHPTRKPVSVSGQLVDLPLTFSHSDFQVYLGAIRESLIPKAVLNQVDQYGPAEIVLIDGPLSVSQWYNLASESMVRNSVDDLVKSRNELLRNGPKTKTATIGIVKRSESRYFHDTHDMKDNMSDQFVFNQVLRHGERTGAVSISKAIKKVATGAALVDKLDFEILGFYLKTSRNPLTPPVRVEFPDYLTDREDELGSYVLSTAVESFDFKYDGLPQAQCLAHRDGKVTKDAMSAIMQEQIAKFSNSEENLRLLSLFSEHVE